MGIVYGLIGFLIGIALGDFFGYLNDFYFLFVGFVALVIWICFDSFKWVVSFSICIFYIAFGFLYFSFFADQNVGEKFVGNFIGHNVEMLVKVVAEPDNRVTGQKLIVRVLDYNLKTDESDLLDGGVLLNLPKYPKYFYGDSMIVKGFLEQPKDDADFSYKRYLERYGIFAVLNPTKIEVVESEQGFSIFKYVFVFKGILQNKINYLWGEPYASFMSGLLIGSRKGIPDFLTEAFSVTGLTHIIAISGYNINLVILITMSMLAFLPRRTKIICAILLIFLFVVCVGMSSAVIRAGIMGSIMLCAMYFGRSSVITITMLLSAVIMNLFNPLILTRDMGFQLSFLATIGVVYISPILKERFVRIPEFYFVKEAFLMTISAQITTLPIILYNFERLSLVAPLANVLVAPFIPLSMLFGAIALLLSFFSDLLAMIVSSFAWFFLEVIIFFTLFCAKLPYASLDNFSIGLLIFFIWYIVLAYLFYANEKGRTKKSDGSNI